MSRKLIGILSILMLAGVLSGVSYANPIPTQITIGPSTTGSITSNTSSVALSGISGWAYQNANSGSYTISDATISVGSGANGVYALGSNSETFSITMGSNWLVGTLVLDTVTGPSTATPLFNGTMTITGESGFAATGFPVGAVVTADFVAFAGKVSAGQIIPDPIPEPGTIAMLGSGLLAIAGTLRRRF